ncbi:pentapeptide repeat-containing protein [Emticicia sp. C21]|uniref:pentapeptide repeat-containing protein n=1 Tax=Emticicia sp. C21 TaxID=2302915 RepID=UPI000E351FDF|nr:pentapeptide repeat-containing protein [Emticicia sp. C21]RFS17877.1 hypothetical protein D0T08_01125 [Emticicia sp. C21]
MEKTNLVTYVLEDYKKGKRYFCDLDMYNESFDNENLEDIVFDGCNLYISFRGANLRNAKFINGGIKTCDFREADLNNAIFENVCIESSQFVRSKTDDVYFNNNSCYGQLVVQAEFDEWIKDFEE